MMGKIGKLRHRGWVISRGLIRMCFSMEFHCFTADVTIGYKEKCIQVKPLIISI